MKTLLSCLAAISLAGCGGLFGTSSDYGLPVTTPSAKRHPVVAVAVGGARAALQLVLAPGTTYVPVETHAFEDVRNDATLPEFDGHYADDASLVLIFN